MNRSGQETKFLRRENQENKLALKRTPKNRELWGVEELGMFTGGTVKGVSARTSGPDCLGSILSPAVWLCTRYAMPVFHL